jgi:hypothetical protein
LPIDTYWTTNYDRLIERSLEDAGKLPDVKYTLNQLATTRKGRDATIYKMHGDVEQPDAAIATKDDYERYFLDNAPFVNALSGDLVSKTFLFIGFGLTDPNLDYVLSRIRIYFKEHQRQHYCIFRRAHDSDYSNRDEFAQARLKQRLVSEDLKRFNIKTLWVDEYSEITDILSSIERRYKRNTVFLSGSAYDYSPWTREVVEEFLAHLGEVLVERGFRIASGIGLGIGNAFVSGAIKTILEEPGRKIEDCALLRPFPQHSADEVQRQQTWQTYRRDFMGRVGIVVFFMGNKHQDGKTTVADGVLEEFRIATELGLPVVPVGASQWAAKEIWETVVGDWDSYFPDANAALRSHLENLGTDSNDPKQLLDSLLESLSLISKE